MTRIPFITGMTAAFLLHCGICGAATGYPGLDGICDSLTVWMEQRTGVRSTVRLKSVTKHKGTVDLQFSRTFSDYPWDKGNLEWFRRTISDSLPSGCTLGEIFCNGVNVKDYLTVYRKKDPRNGSLFIERIGARRFPKGLDGRYIALWQSHGKYFDAGEGVWKWQRAPVHRTVEDLFTQSFVLKYLIPMLENSGAYVMTPRERDTQVNEMIADNDTSFTREPYGYGIRGLGIYEERGKWNDAGTGFADCKVAYSGLDNPFVMGTARKAECRDGAATASASWSFEVPERGRYAVYIAYRSLPQSTTKAHYTVKHLGGSTEFRVNQTKGGGMWVYLGEFEFSGEGCVVLDNAGPSGTFITADAVRLGGGMGKIDRGAGVSGVPSYCEGAMYSMQWSGTDSEIWNGHDDDYTNDFAGRGAWVKSLRDDRDIPVDLSLGFHTDAGTALKDTTIGTLAIYTLKSEGKRKMSDGTDRMACRRFAQKVQDEVVGVIRSDFCPDWTRRELWDRSYSESRTSDVPAMILELLSHQNFSDMRFGLNPEFQFAVSRAVYKGMLKFLSELYGCPYVVQPLPVRNFSVSFGEAARAHLQWEPTPDPREESAMPKGYTVYMRIDDGAFGKGIDVKGCSVDLEFPKDHVCSYRVVAWNDGGRSFPSETLCIGMPSSASGSNIQIVNNFTRLSAPSWIEGGTDIAGFDGREDNGVPYMDDISYIGQVYDFDRSHPWTCDSDPGFGACHSDYACRKVAGNTFDYPSLHGKVFLGMGIPFCSTSVGAFIKMKNTAETVDLICGKQTDVFPEALQNTLRQCTASGCSLLISGANIGTACRTDSLKFAYDVLGYKWVSSHGTADGRVSDFSISHTPNPYRYCVENPDAIGLRSGSAAIASGSVVMRYPGTSYPAAVHFSGQGYKVASYGFPIECIESETDFNNVLSGAIEFLRK